MSLIFPPRATAKSTCRACAVSGWPWHLLWRRLCSDGACLLWRGVPSLIRLPRVARADLALAADRLSTGLQRYRELAVLLADHPVVVTAVLAGGGAQGETNRAAAELLQSTADKTGAYALGIYDDSGRALQVMDNAVVTAAALERALDGALGADRVIVKGEATPYTETPETALVDKRRYIFAAPVFRPRGPARGAFVVHVEIEALEWFWPNDPSAVYFTGSLRSCLCFQPL